MNQKPVPILPSFITHTPNLSSLIGRQFCVLYSNKYSTLNTEEQVSTVPRNKEGKQNGHEGKKEGEEDVK